jgi:hypothetical protein
MPTRNILHIGMPKTGTTTLQSTLTANAGLLSDCGICYPVGLSSSPCNHRILACLAMDPRSYPRHMWRFRDPRLSQELFAELREKLAAQIEGSSSASVLVLSAEALFTRIRRHRRKQYAAFADSLGTHLAIVSYLRSPAKFYLSVCQQKLKASQKISPIASARYRQVIQSYQDIFPSAEISLIAFERQSLIGQDIVVDFCQRFFSDTSLEPSSLVRADDSNVSLSAESMAMSMLYRRYFLSKHDDVHVPESSKMIKLLRKADQLVGASHPSLLEGVRHEIESLASKDLFWLRSRHGLVFNDINYDKLRWNLLSTPLKRQPRLLSDIVHLDESKIREIVDVLASTRFFRKSAARANWLKMVASLRVSAI